MRKYVRLPHAVFFIHDMGKNIEIPKDTNLSIVRSTPSCISVWGTHELEGKTLIVLSSKKPKFEMNHVFSGNITTPSRNVILTNSEAKLLMRVHVPSDESLIEIFVNELRSPSVVQVQIEL